MNKTEIDNSQALCEALELIEANGDFLSPSQQREWCKPEMGLLRIPTELGERVPAFQFNQIGEPVAIVLAVHQHLVVNLRGADDIVYATNWWFTANKSLGNKRPVDLMRNEKCNSALLKAARADSRIPMFV